MKRTYRLLAIMLAVICMVVGCGSNSEAAESNKETESQLVKVTDMKGREIALDAPATKVVALTASDCEIIYALGAGDLLVGRGEFCDYPEEVFNLPAVNSGAETNIEQIIALEPQILFMSDMTQTKEQVEQLESAGIKVVVSEASDINGVYDSIGIIGTLLGKSKEAEELCASMKTSFDDLKAKAEANEAYGKKSIYFEVSPLEWGLWTAGAGTFMDEIAGMLGIRNSFADVSGWAEISEEQVLDRNPDYILTISGYYGEGPTPVEEILGRPGWENVNAVKNAGIVNLQNNELSRPAPRLVDGAKMLFDMVYGE